MHKQWNDDAGDKAPRQQAFLLALAAWALLLLLRCVTIGGPILASDEYAYNILSHFLGQEELFAFDPRLQHIANPLYLAIQHLWTVLDGGNGLLVTRVVHVFEWLASSIILYATFVPLLGVRTARLGAAGMLLLPTSFYTLTVMPETDLVLMATLVGYIAIRWQPIAPLRAAAAAGAISGLALLLKPHAIAWVPAMVALLVCSGFLYRREKGIAPIVAAALLFLVGWYGGFLFGWRLSFGSWEWNPSAALGLKFYGAYMHKAGESGFWAGNILQILRYVIAHLLVMAMLFLPALAAILAIGRQTLVGRNLQAQGLFAAAAFVLFMLVSHLLMVAYFSTSAGDKNAFEALRLHGRYMGSILVFLPFLYFAFVQSADARTARRTAAAGALVCIAFYFFIFRIFKLYPWDYPELFAFFSFPNHYGWGFDGPSDLGYIAMGLCALGFVVVLIRPSLFRIFMTAQLAFLLALGSVQMQHWLISNMNSNAPNIDMATALGKALSPAQPGDGLLIGEERYGSMSYILFHLGSAPRVLTREAGATISADDVKQASWVVTAANYNIEFPHRNLVRFGALTLYPLRTVDPIVVSMEKHDWDGSTFDVKLGRRDGEAALQGFNTLEDWGAWTSAPEADIELPYFVEGDVVIELFGWVIPENLDNPLRLTLGDGSASVKLGDKGADYRVELHASQRSDHLRLAIPVFRPDGSARNMGVGIARLKISRKPADNP